MTREIGLSDIQAARARIAHLLVQTPVLADDWLSHELHASIHVKAECLQRSGSFKIRGAANSLAMLTDDERSRGVIAHSAGNHAQGVAFAARSHGIEATIVMPETAPLTKVNATRALGAHVVLFGSSFDEAGLKCRELQAEHGYTLVHAFNDPHVIAGQGTIGLEIIEQLRNVTLLVVPIGGGGLISGIAIAARSFNPGIRIVGVQAEGCATINRSLNAGSPMALTAAQTIADGIAVKRPGDLTLPIIRKYVDHVVEVSEDDIARGIAHCVQRLHLVTEGAGAAGIAALLAGKISVQSTDVVCAPLCGGNIDGNLLSRVVEQVMVRAGRYVLLKCTVVDRPGALAPLLNEVAGAGGNVVDVFHRRAVWLAPLGRVGIELVLEVRDASHSDSIVAHLTASGYHVEREGVGMWPE